VVSNASAILAVYMNSINIVLSIFMAALFLVLYFAIQLTLFKHIFQVLDREPGSVRLSASFPTVKEMIYFFTCAISVMMGVFIIYMIISVLFFPLIYAAISVDDMVQIVFVITFILVSYILLRILFFPFFILDKGVK